jgi:hypothetical protein
MNDTPNRRKDDARPAVALQWGERPDQWTLLLTGPTAGVIGPLGSTWPNHPAELERVDVCVRRKDGPAVVYRTGGEGATTWHQFYPCTSAEPLRDGEMLYREGAVPKLDNIELYRLQMAGISAASLGHWKLGDSIHPDYDTVPLRDVAALYVKYEELFKFRESVRGMVHLLKNREWAEDLGATGDAAELQAVITELVGARLELLDTLIDKFDGWADASGDRAAHEGRDVLCCENSRANAIYSCIETLKELHPAYAKRQAAPDAVDAAMRDAVVNGTGAFRVHADGSTEHVDLYQAPTTEGGPA